MAHTQIQHWQETENPRRATGMPCMESSIDSRYALEQFLLSNPQVKLVRFHWVDLSGVLHTKFIPTQRALQLASGKTELEFEGHCMVTPISEPLRNEGEAWHLIPDWATLAICGHSAKHASVMGFMSDPSSDNPFKRCPRRLFQAVMHRFQLEHKTEVLMGFELEFVLLDESGKLIRGINALDGFCTTNGLRGQNMIIMEEIMEALDISAIPVYAFNNEGRGDQLEITLSPSAPMQAVDAAMLAVETVRTICVRHGRRATMSPKPVNVNELLPKPVENGCHVHLTLNPHDDGAFYAFIHGVLDKLPALCALGMANYDSYDRVIHRRFGHMVGWGTENRRMPVRKIKSSNRWELRFLDFTANLYLALAAVFAAGSDGMTGKVTTKWTDCNYASYLNANEAELVAFGITEPIPTSLESALSLLELDGDLGRWLGDDMTTRYLRLKRTEIANFSEMTEEERRLRFITFF